MIEFNTREFEFSHGHRPRGFGDWAFRMIDSGTTSLFWVHQSTYGDAKKQARNEARRLGVTLVKVQP